MRGGGWRWWAAAGCLALAGDLTRAHAYPGHALNADAALAHAMRRAVLYWQGRAPQSKKRTDPY